LFDKIKKTQERLIVSLTAAWEVAPNDPEIRRDLLHTIEKAMKLREKIYKDVVNEEPPEIRTSYENLKRIIEAEHKIKY
jgi:hypothetical protein